MSGAPHTALSPSLAQKKKIFISSPLAQGESCEFFQVILSAGKNCERLLN